MKKGLFITFEGIDGCGKSTQIEYFKNILINNGIDFICVREPGGTAISEKIRTLLLDKENSRMANETEVLLFAASRAQLLSEVILTALNSGKIVLCDRFIDSSLAYQGYARQLDINFIKAANSYALDNCMPDYTLYFDISPEDVKQRLSTRGQSDRIEAEEQLFHQRVYEGYNKIYSDTSRNIIKIDANGSIEEVYAQVLQAARSILKKW